jgi:transposase InsO family protein
MRDNHIRAKTARRFRIHTTDSDHDLPVADNLLDRQFNPSAANQAWVADITSIPTREGWLLSSDGKPSATTWLNRASAKAVDCSVGVRKASSPVPLLMMGVATSE